MNSEPRSRLCQPPRISAPARGDAPPQTSSENPASHTPCPCSKAQIAQQQWGGEGKKKKKQHSPKPVILTEQTTRYAFAAWIGARGIQTAHPWAQKPLEIPCSLLVRLEALRGLMALEVCTATGAWPEPIPRQTHVWALALQGGDRGPGLCSALPTVPQSLLSSQPGEERASCCSHLGPQAGNATLGTSDEVTRPEGSSLAHEAPQHRGTDLLGTARARTGAMKALL